jgi:signal transduction histidine kinase
MWMPGRAGLPYGRGVRDRDRQQSPGRRCDPGAPARDDARAADGGGRAEWAGWGDGDRWAGPSGRKSYQGKHHDWPGGAVIAAGLFHVLGAKSQAGDGGVFRPMDLLAYAILLIGPLALGWRRKAPVVVVAVAAAASIGFATFAEPRWTFAVAPVIALFAAVRAGRGRAAFGVAAPAYLAYLLITSVFAAELGVPAGARPDLRTALLLAAMLIVAMILGGGSKARAEQMAEMRKTRAERARVREEQERRLASEERLRIARELHDVLGHHLSLINVQAGVGLHLMDNRPEQAREALTAIKTASSEALREVRAVLGVLRPEEEAAPRQPALGLDRMDELTADAGLPVTTTTTGERRALPAEVDRAAYRIVQEALTNVRKHAVEGAAAEVAVEYRAADLRLTVRNDGPKPADGAGRAVTGLLGAASGLLGGTRDTGAEPPAAGSGIAGMRARAESLGGTLAAGPRPEGGFAVTAVLPTTEEALRAEEAPRAGPEWAEGPGEAPGPESEPARMGKTEEPT